MNRPTLELATFRTCRHFPVAPAVVYAAFANPDWLASWWGPDGFRNTFQTFEFKTGGRWDFVMHGPDGRDHVNRCVFRDLVPDHRLVIEHVCAPHFTLTVELQARSAATELVWVQAFDDATVAESVRHIVEPSNEQNLDRLAALLRSRRH